jgi:hypothetical protein
MARSYGGSLKAGIYFMGVVILVTTTVLVLVGAILYPRLAA